VVADVSMVSMANRNKGLCLPVSCSVMRFSLLHVEQLSNKRNSCWDLYIIMYLYIYTASCRFNYGLPSVLYVNILLHNTAHLVLSVIYLFLEQT
jgi:hypothetical protein